MRKLTTRIKQAAVGTAAALVATAASAGAAADAVKAGVDNAELIAIGIVVLTIAGIVLFVKSGKRVAN
ncbi:hypothetical protein [Lysobacter sp. Hz 25]|uniref:hypothetical protein n=1 Tax=Lysobacter sp. Hz 25 TaxID=3383698 RepID=UPI0038D3F85D